MGDTTTQRVGEIAARCESAGLLCWVRDGSGALLHATEAHHGLFGAEAIKRLALIPDTGSKVHELVPGLWVASIAGGDGCGGMLVTLAAMGPDFLLSSIFHEACAEVSAASAKASRALEGVARFDRMTGEAAMSLASEVVRDLCRLSDQDETIQGFTNQLSAAFDNIACLYALGRGMNDPTKPGEFLKLVCAQLGRSTDFAWVAAFVSEDGRGPENVAGRLFLHGAAPLAHEAMLAAAGELSRSARSSMVAQILSGVPGLSLPGAPQVLVHPLQRGQGPQGALLAGGKPGHDTAITSWDTQLFEAAAGFIGSYLENVALYDDQRRLFLGTLQALTSAIDAKDRYTCGHSERVSLMSAAIAKGAGLSEEEVEQIRIAGLVHDVGKIGVPEAVLTKQGRLTDAEFDAIKRHPQIGHSILRDIPQLSGVLPGVLHHHERYDGRGYPTGLSGEGIPLQARIIAVADTFDAMSSTRSYRPAMPRDKVLAELQRCAGTQFDPRLIPVFLSLDLSVYDSMVARHAMSEAVTPLHEAPITVEKAA